jgi:hypothetical protein
VKSRPYLLEVEHQDIEWVMDGDWLADKRSILVQKLTPFVPHVIMGVTRSAVHSDEEILCAMVINKKRLMRRTKNSSSRLAPHQNLLLAIAIVLDDVFPLGSIRTKARNR